MSGKPKDKKDDDEILLPEEDELTVGLEVSLEDEEEPPPPPAASPEALREVSEKPLDVEVPETFAAKPYRNEGLRDDLERLDRAASSSLKHNVQADHSRVLRSLAVFAFFTISAALGFFYFLSQSPEPVPPAAVTPASPVTPVAGTHAPAPAAAPAPVAESSRAGVLIETDMVGFEVFVNGKPVSLFNNRFETAAGGNIEILVRRVGYTDYRVIARLEAGGENVIRPVFNQESSTGFLTVDSASTLKVTVFKDGKVIFEGNTPVSGQKIPVGKYQLVLENSFMGQRTAQEIEIFEWRTTSVQR